MITQCEPILCSDKAIQSDHVTILTTIHIPKKYTLPCPTPDLQKHNVIQQKERIQFKNIQNPEHRAALTQAVADEAHNLQTLINQTLNSNQSTQFKTNKIFEIFTSTQLKVAEQTLGKYAIRSHTQRKTIKLGKTMSNLRQLGLRIPPEVQQERNEAFTAFKSAHKEIARHNRPANMHEITKRY